MRLLATGVRRHRDHRAGRLRFAAAEADFPLDGPGGGGIDVEVFHRFGRFGGSFRWRRLVAATGGQEQGRE